VDESGSVQFSNFILTQQFLSQLVGRLDIDSGSTRVGLVTFSNEVDTQDAFNLNEYSSVASVQTAISSLTYSGGGTNAAKALRHVHTTMLTSAAGDRSGVPNVVIFMTDGQLGVLTITQVCTT